MTAILALVPNVLTLIGMGVPFVQNLVAWVEGIRATAQQSGEWDSDLEAAFVASLITLAKSKAWTPDAQLPKVASAS